MEAIREELDLVEEIRIQASMREAVIPREFDIGDLVLRRANVASP